MLIHDLANSIVIPLQQGLRQILNEVNLTFDDSIVIPLQQGLRQNDSSTFIANSAYSIVIPLQQGLRLCEDWPAWAAAFNSIVIPLQQGLRHTRFCESRSAVATFYRHSITTRIKTRQSRCSAETEVHSIVIPLQQGLRPDHLPEELQLSEFYRHSITTRIKT